MNKKLWEKAVEFHGHECPGLAIGVRACEVVMEKMGIGTSKDEEIVCITENDACGVDAIQVLLGCSIGKGNLIYRGTGKQAFSFFNRNNGDKLRIYYNLKIDTKNRLEKQKFILEGPVEEIFTFSMPNYNLPEEARIFTSIQCECCKEKAPEHKMHLEGGNIVCQDCFNHYNRGW